MVLNEQTYAQLYAYVHIIIYQLCLKIEIWFTSDHIDIIEYVNVAHSIGSETLFKITGTCGQDPMVPLIAHPSFFLASIIFHVHNILQLSMYYCMTYIQKKETIKQQFLSILGF